MILPTRTVEKIWGRDRLPAPFRAPEGRRIGEIWFEPPAQMPQLLVKHIFTSEKLSVQCHPSDTQTLAAGLGRQGKEECWLVLDAEPGATLGIGFEHPVDAATMRAAALDGRIEGMLTWHKVRPGDFFYIPANTVHAIGAGCAILEIQQNSDITYRLYDYGRARELHLDEGLAVAAGTPYDLAAHSRPVPRAASLALVDGPHFRLDQLAGPPHEAIRARYPGPLLVMPREGTVRINTGLEIGPGQCALAASLDALALAPHAVCLIAQPAG